MKRTLSELDVMKEFAVDRGMVLKDLVIRFFEAVALVASDNHLDGELNADSLQPEGRPIKDELQDQTSNRQSEGPE